MNYVKVYLLPLILVVVSCNSPVINEDAQIYWAEIAHNFGKLSYKKEASYRFLFTNPGKTPLVIYDVQTSCGCTVPEWTKIPIKQDGGGEIKITYDATFPGVFHKTIKVYYNGKDSPKELSIKGEVAYPDDLEGTEDEK